MCRIVARALGVCLSMGLVLLLPGAARLFNAKCAIPNHHNTRTERFSHQTVRAGSPRSTKALSPQATYAHKNAAKLGLCKVMVGTARLGGEPGTLITSFGPGRRTTRIFCRRTPSTDCFVRTATPTVDATGWIRSSLKQHPIAQGQFAYRIERAEGGELIMILFGPDIAAYRPKAAALHQIKRSNADSVSLIRQQRHAYVVSNHRDASPSTDPLICVSDSLLVSTRPNDQ